MLRKLGKKGASGTFHHNRRVGLNGVPVAAKLNRFDNFLRATYSASDVCIGDVEEAHCICISMCGTNERIQLAQEFLQSVLLLG